MPIDAYLLEEQSCQI